MNLFTDRNIVIGLVLLQAAVCLPFINSFPIALDEPFSIFWAQQDLGEMLNLVSNGNNSPLHFILLNGWVHLFGISPFSVRSMSLIFSLVTVVVIYILSRKLLNQWFSVFAVLLFVFSKFNHFHSIEARMYSLFTMLFALSLLYNYELLIERKNRILILSVINIALLYTHYLAVIGIASQVFIFGFYWNQLNKKTILRLALIIGLTGLFFLPGLLILIERIIQQKNAVSWVPAPHPTELYGNIFRFCNGTLTFVILAIMILGFAYYKFNSKWSLLLKEMRKTNSLFFLLSFLIPYLSIYIYSILISPIFLDRYLLFTTIPLFILIANFFSIVVIEKFQRLTILSVAAVMMLGVGFIPKNNREPDKAAEFVRNEMTSNSKILIAPPYYDLTFIYHYNSEMFQEMVYDSLAYTKYHIQPIYNFDEVKDTSELSQLILVDDNSESAYPGNNIKDKLSQWGILIKQKVFLGGTTVMVFSKL